MWFGGGLYSGFDDTIETVSIASSAADDTAGGTGARRFRGEGLSPEGIYQFEDFATDGTNPIVSQKQWLRFNRIEVTLSGSEQTNAGNLTVTGTTSGTVYAVAPAGFGGTQICAHTIPANTVGLLEKVRATVRGTSSAVRRADCDLRVRKPGTNTFRLIRPSAASTDEAWDEDRLFLELPPLTDIALTVAEVTANTTVMTGELEIYLIER